MAKYRPNGRELSKECKNYSSIFKLLLYGITFQPITPAFVIAKDKNILWKLKNLTMVQRSPQAAKLRLFINLHKRSLQRFQMSCKTWFFVLGFFFAERGEKKRMYGDT